MTGASVAFPIQAILGECPVWSRDYRLVFSIGSEPDAGGPTTLNAGDSCADYAVPLGQRGYRQESLLFEGTRTGVTRIIFSSTTATEAGPLVDDVGIELI